MANLRASPSKYPVRVPQCEHATGGRDSTSPQFAVYWVSGDNRGANVGRVDLCTMCRTELSSSRLRCSGAERKWLNLLRSDPSESDDMLTSDLTLSARGAVDGGTCKPELEAGAHELADTAECVATVWLVSKVAGLGTCATEPMVGNKLAGDVGDISGLTLPAGLGVYEVSLGVERVEGRGATSNGFTMGVITGGGASALGANSTPGGGTT